eukprot:CAMPEP_0119553734 /NCGR_PEP_ID=MMETSP1352-20130426/6412_1 /TAXON_ID=265584 /ORGANISM="Stauroneis constricta, Strain CCMP1120" /LENGTH=637 /DNA_ID=CAMNT_0007600195 /DNA_START=15 /DNA_END=1924 /DNA_ORIENTATION=-
MATKFSLNDAGVSHDANVGSSVISEQQRQQNAEAKNDDNAAGWFSTFKATVSNGLAVFRDQQQQPPPNDCPMINEKIGAAGAATADAAATNSAGFNDHDDIDINFDDPSSILAHKMDEMTLEERCRVYEDIHGVNPVLEETESFLAAKLDDLDMELAMIKTKPAYDHAKQLNGAYITNKQLRACFLRCSDFDSRKAAKHLVGWCELKMELFGPVVMGRDLRMSDLCPISRDMLETGVHQFLRKKDSAGRLVICGIKLKTEYFANMALSKLIIYMSNCIMYDESVQKNGVVAVNGYGEIKMSSMTLEHAKNMLRGGYKTTKYVPLRIRAMHYMGDGSLAKKRMVSAMQMAAAQQVGRRVRFYSGTIKENLLALTGFGIPVDVLPFDENGVFDTSSHLPWIEERRRLEMALEAAPTTAPTPTLTPTASVASEEAALTIISNDVDAAPIHDMDVADNNDNNDDCQHQNNDSTLASCELVFQPFEEYDHMKTEEVICTPPIQHNHDNQIVEKKQIGKKEPPTTTDGNTNEKEVVIMNPSDQDVLMGRGKKTQQHPGNIALRETIAERYDEYDQSKRWGKMAVATSIVESIAKQNGRFLKKVDNDGDDDKGGGGICWVAVSDNEAREKVSHGFRKKRELDLA